MNFRRRISKKITLLFFGDALLLYAALLATLMLRTGAIPSSKIIHEHLFWFTILFPMWLLTFGATGLYDLRLLRNIKSTCYRILRVMTINGVLTIVFFYLFPAGIEPRRNLFLIAAIATAFIALWRFAVGRLIIHVSPSRVAFFGISPDINNHIMFLLNHPQFGHKPVVAVAGAQNPPMEISDYNRPLFPTIPSPGNMRYPSSSIRTYPLRSTNLPSLIREFNIDTVVVSPEMKIQQEVVATLLAIIPRGIAVIEFPAFHEMITGKIPLSLIGELWFLENLIGIRQRSYEFTKRAFDLALAVLLTIPALLVMPLISLAIKVDSQGPVFFRQTRVGKHGKPFILLKYRSMVENAALMGGLKENGNARDVRQTRVGSILRASYLDEIPQIINILRGEMSFIGPRPERPEFVKELKGKIPFYETRFLVPPGITGWAQVHMENDASVEDAPEKMQYDLYYVKNRSWVLDLLITLRTISIILQRKGR